MKKSLILLSGLISLIYSSIAYAQESFKVYPVQGIFLSDRATENHLFKKALSSDNSGNNLFYALDQFNNYFKANFSNAVDTLDNKNKYNTFVVWIQIPRVSQYKIDKSPKLVDYYLPLTMSINFANMVTGEILYSYSYTYYARYETIKQSGNQLSKIDEENKIIQLYKDTYSELIKKIIQTSKEKFNPFSVRAAIKKDWNDNFILDKGTEAGIIKGDVLVDQYGTQITVLHSSGKFSVAQALLGEKRNDSQFIKFSNESLDELKKPKVLLLSNSTKKLDSPVTESVIYQLFINALGKKASFSLMSLDKSFYNVQKAVIEMTHLTQEITQNREVPDYFLRVHFAGPFYSKLPSTKPYITYDNYKVVACGELLDKNGRVLFSTCTDEEITDEVFGDIRYSNEAREEMIIKNVIVKLSTDFIDKVKFKKVEASISKTSGNQIDIEDQNNILFPEENISVFHKFGKLEGIDEDIYVPTWEAKVISLSGNTAMASTILPLSAKNSAPSVGDKIILMDIITNLENKTKLLKMCSSRPGDKDSMVLDDFEQLVPFMVSRELKFPFYAGEDFRNSIQKLNEGGFGFKRKIVIPETKSDYCLEAIYKIEKQAIPIDNNIITYKCSVISGVKIYEKNNIIWKKGLQQNINVSAPKDYEKNIVGYETSKQIFDLLSNIVKKIEINTP